MSDDLIARLRASGWDGYMRDMHQDAADAIDSLDSALEAAQHLAMQRGDELIEKDAEIERLTAERDAATAAERERISDNVWDAVMDDCENGVKWLNETASEKLMMNYPALWAALGAIRKGTP